MSFRERYGVTEAEHRKPQSDEARSFYDSEITSEFAVPDGLAMPRTVGGEPETTSEFALPKGLDVPQPTAAEPEGSAFTAPRTYSAKDAPPAFTPPTGIPVVSLTKDVPWQDRMRTMLRMPVAERPAPEPVHKSEDDAGPAVPRVLDLTLRIGELLLAGGEGAEDVEAAMFAVCRSYGLDRCEPNVTFTLLSISYQPSLVDDPVTASRTVRRRGTDYTRLAAVFQLVDDLSDPETAISLEDAYRRLAEIRRNRHPYPTWVLTSASGLLAGAASVLVGGDLLVFVAAMLGAMLGDRLAWLCAGRGLPEFYQFTVAAMPPAAIGIALTLAHVDVKASAVITGGLFALLPGRALVAGVQDGLTGFYITASARLLEVMYFFVGIVVGVLVMLYVGVQLGAHLNPDEALFDGFAAAVADRGVDAAVTDVRRAAAAGTIHRAGRHLERRRGLVCLRRDANRRVLPGRLHGRRGGARRSVRAVAVPVPVRVRAAVHDRGDRAPAAGFRHVLRVAVDRRERGRRRAGVPVEGGGARHGHRHRGQPGIRDLPVVPEGRFRGEATGRQEDAGVLTRAPGRAQYPWLL
ncbi:hypothetical protein SCANM124S_04563 [Streptomyces canus]